MATTFAEAFAKPEQERLCAIGAHGGGRVNAQVCVSVLLASIVRDRPRLVVALWNTNYTCELVRTSGTMCLTLLTRANLGLIEPLGMHSGRDRDKLAGVEYGLTARGDPYFAGGAGYLSGDVLQQWDLGDCTAFVVAMREEGHLAGGDPITWAQARDLLPAEAVERYSRKVAADRAWSRERMAW